MFSNTFGGWHLLAILLIVLLIFGAPKLPQLARSLGQSMRIFRGEVDEMKKDRRGKRDRTAATVETDGDATDTSTANLAEPETHDVGAATTHRADSAAPDLRA